MSFHNVRNRADPSQRGGNPDPEFAQTGDTPAIITAPRNPLAAKAGRRRKTALTGAGASGRGRWSWQRVWVPLPLLPVLVVQAFLSYRLVWSNTAYTDEALYLWAGHLEIAHWLHGTPLPAFPTYFSGAPVIYPPLAALADSLGKLAGARLLSLAFMLGATLLLWATTSRLFGLRAAFFGTGLWAVLGPTIFLGAYATYDAMSLFFLSLASWLVTRSAAKGQGMPWIISAACALILANATKYASLIFDPVIILLAVFAVPSSSGGRVAKSRGAALLTLLSAGVIILLKIAGNFYSLGINATTVARANGSTSIAQVVTSTWTWIGVVLAVALLGFLLSLTSLGHQSFTPLLATLLGAGLLVPFEQARIHTIISLYEHVDFGAWFAAMPAGYAAARLIALMSGPAQRATATVFCALALTPLAAVGAAQARQSFSWPNANAAVAALSGVADVGTGPLLVENSSIFEYYLPSGHDWKRWSNTFSITTRAGASVGYTTASITGLGAERVYHRYVDNGYFSVIALNFYTGGYLDQAMSRWLHRDPAYQVVMRVPYGGHSLTIWERVPPSRTHHGGRAETVPAHPGFRARTTRIVRVPVN